MVPGDAFPGGRVVLGDAFPGAGPVRRHLLVCGRTARREPVHEVIAVGLSGGFEVVGPAEDPAVVDGVLTATGPRLDVVDLEVGRCSADSAVGRGPLAAGLVTLHDFPLHLGGHGGLPLRLLLEEGLERRDEDLLVGGTGVAVALAGLRLLEEFQEPGGDGDVEADLPGREGNDNGSARSWFNR